MVDMNVPSTAATILQAINVFIAFDKGERIPNLALGVLCLTQGRKNRDFLCNGTAAQKGHRPFWILFFAFCILFLLFGF